ncbi:tRNA G18 (ribose-2'-O)-methylase SpoU [Prosthecomicrobium pneumaticum]|uniref:tRNA G18 (Ribose-2'-O)-methylase SpoU n=1 Tax=Prosthecomicrobium pneumaticum TaxID=81895 RepID=A0A7W9CVE0_9HYPH|nr:RNA methyltransferase [Prosthecomicrobium pneumaticum]MBB5752298.1 tRNA G18 (ribose-2'-O)-methylase SpoU [Prosthecomicrobium pneumaticum]
MTLVPIDDPSDPRLDPYRAVRERDLVGRAGLFVAEGEVVLRMLAASRRFAAVSALIVDKRRDKLADLLAALDPDVPVYLVPQAVIDTVAGFEIHRGILALGRRPEPVPADALLAGLPARALVVAAVGIANHDNMGGIFRNAAAFGAAAVLLDPTSCDPLYRKAIRVSVGGVLAMPFARLAAEDDLPDLLARHGFTAFALSPQGSTRLADLARPPRAAVILGAEGPGLPAALLARTHTVRIPMAAGFDSLNVATTSGIVLHRLAEADGLPVS